MSCAQNDVGHIPIYQIICFRNSIVFLGYLAYLHLKSVEHVFPGPPIVRKWIWLRGILSSLGLIMAFLGLRYLSISEFATVFCLAPFGTAIMCRMFVGEPFPSYQVVSCIVSFAGVILVADPLQAWSSIPGMSHPELADLVTSDGLPHDLMSKVIGIALVLTCALILGMETVVMRIIKDPASPSQINVVTPFCPAVFSAFIMCVTRTEVVYPRGNLQWLLVLGVLICGFLAQYTQTYSYAKLSGIRSAIPSYTSLVNMPVLQWAIYGNHPSRVAFVGMSIVTSAGLFSVIRGVESELSSNLAEDDIERELMRSPSTSLLFSPSRDQNDQVVTPVRYQG